MKALILALALLALPAHAEDKDTFCGITEGQSPANVRGVKTDNAITLTPYSLGVYQGTRVVSICHGKVHNIGWNRIYSDASVNIGYMTPLVQHAAVEVAALSNMMIEAGWYAGPVPDIATVDARSGWNRRFYSVVNTDERVLSLTQIILDSGITFWKLSIITATDTICNTGM